MRAKVLGVSALAVAAAFGLVGCGTDQALQDAQEPIKVGETNYVTIPPAPVTTPPPTTPIDAPGSILPYETEYTILADDYPSTVASKFKVKFEDLMTLNSWTLLESGIVPEWPGVGGIIKIPAGATVPGEPPDPGPLNSSTTVAGAPAEPPTTTAAATTTTEPEGESCGTYEIVAGDTPGVVATKLNTTIDKLDSVNRSTKGYKGFVLGITINVPC
jgi:LysM repeat protein